MGDRLNALATLIDAYESEHYPIGPPYPIEAIKSRMEQQGLTRRDLEAMLGLRARAAKILNRKRDNMMGCFRAYDSLNRSSKSRLGALI